MVKTWLVRLELARDDGEALSDEGIGKLTGLLTESGVFPNLHAGDEGTVLVQVKIDATSDRAARAAAESILRARAYEVWVALGLPPFTIAFVEAQPEADETS